MENKIREAFGSITAGPELIKATYEAVAGKTKKEKNRNRSFVKRLSFAAASVVVLLFIVGFNLYGSETAYISLDVNPSISLAVNRFDKVIAVIPYNEEGREIVDGVSVRNRDYAEAVQAIMDSPQMQPYLSGAPTMWVTVQANDSIKVETVERSVQSVVDTALKQHHAETQVEYSCVGEQTRIEAETNGVSAAKYTAILELQQYDPSVSVEQYKHHSMHDINAEIASHHGGSSAQGHTVNGGGAQTEEEVQAQPGEQGHHGRNSGGQSSAHNGGGH